jgi:hypothetical protein
MSVYNIRLATQEDFDDVYELARQFFFESPYKHSCEFSEARVKEVIHIYLTAHADKMIVCLLTCNEVPVGLIAGVAMPSLFSDGVQTMEQIWWVHPAHRKTRHCLGLLAAYQEWSRKIGAVSTVVGDLPGVTDLERLYTRLGYTPVERAFIRRV